MRDNEKLKIVTMAQKLILMLEDCDDEGFLDLILNCVMSADTLSLEELKKWY